MPPWRCFRLRAQLARQGGWLPGRLLTMVSGRTIPIGCDQRTTLRLCAINPAYLPSSSQEILPAMPLAPPVGVVIANHNNGAFVEKAIESVACQTVRDLQVVVVDDASTDHSDEVIRRCLARLGDTRFRFVKLGASLGQAGALRRGMAELDTPFVCFLDSDDACYDDFVARHLAGGAREGTAAGTRARSPGRRARAPWPARSVVMMNE